MNEPLYCVNHPRVETRLRCNKCGQPICSKCAVRTPVGYRCRECVNVQQRAFYTGFRASDYLIAGAVALPLSLVAGWFVPRLGWFAILLGPAAGGGIAEAVRWAVKRKRGRHTWLVVCGSVVVGVLPVLILSLISLTDLIAMGLGPVAGAGAVLRLVWVGVYVLTATGAAYARLRPGKRI
ncbi:MAG: B-box zinc finger protein [Anaerolineae bacterium]